MKEYKFYGWKIATLGYIFHIHHIREDLFNVDFCLSHSYYVLYIY